MKVDTTKWADMVSKDAATNKAIKDRTSQFQKEVDQEAPIRSFLDRADEMNDKHGLDVLKIISYVLEPLVGATTSQDETPVSEIARSPLKGQSREDVIRICNNHGLRTLEQLLQLIDRIQQAQRGALFKNSQTSS